jgi:hypothetical protein
MVAYNYAHMPLTVFDIKGVPGTRRERIEAAVVTGGKHLSGAHEAWIAPDPFRGGFEVLMTEPHGFQRTGDVCNRRRSRCDCDGVRETLDD